jgi:hypothetical protein
MWLAIRLEYWISLWRVQNLPNGLWLVPHRAPKMHREDERAATGVVLENALGRRVGKNAAVPVELAVDAHGGEGRRQRARRHDVGGGKLHLPGIEIVHDACAGKNELAPEIREQDSSVPLVDCFGVGLALGKIELLLGGAYINAVVGELAEINLAMSHRQVFLGNDRDVMCPENRIAPAVNFIHRDCDGAIAMGVFERFEVESAPRWTSRCEAFVPGTKTF